MVNIFVTFSYPVYKNRVVSVNVSSAGFNDFNYVWEKLDNVEREKIISKLIYNELGTTIEDITNDDIIQTLYKSKFVLCPESEEEYDLLTAKYRNDESITILKTIVKSNENNALEQDGE